MHRFELYSSGSYAKWWRLNEKNERTKKIERALGTHLAQRECVHHILRWSMWTYWNIYFTSSPCVCCVYTTNNNIIISSSRFFSSSSCTSRARVVVVVLHHRSRRRCRRCLPFFHIACCSFRSVILFSKSLHFFSVLLLLFHLAY